MTRRVVSQSLCIAAAAVLSLLASVGRSENTTARVITDDTSPETTPPPSSPPSSIPVPAPTAASRAAAATTSDGSVLRLVAGLQGLAPEPDSQLLEPIPAPEPSLPSSSSPPGMPPSVVDSFDSGAAEGASQSMPRFTTPHEATAGEPYLGLPARRPLLHLPPPTFIPLIGPRTSETARFIGWGEPLYGASWLNRPLGASFFAGFMQGSAPIRGLVGQHGGFFGGYRITWDYDYYYGLEARLGGGAIGLKYPGYDYPTATSDLYVADISMFYYPLGDARWRPFVSAGLGTTKISFFDRADVYYGGVLVSTPVSVGIKYRWRDWAAIRGEITDNVAYGRGPFSTMNNVSYTAGVEIRFGGLRKSYFPWHPNGQIW